MTPTIRRPYRSLAFAFVALALLAGQGRAQESATIEGHVFNKLTGVPAEGSSVVIRGHSNVNPSVPVVLARDHTDGNGFYSLEVSDRDRPQPHPSGPDPSRVGRSVRRLVYNTGPE